MKPPRFAGKVIYFFGYPIFRLLIKGTNRAYVLMYRDDEILLTKNWLGFQKKWRLPGGGIRYGESPSVAALRELQEEIGVKVDASQISQLTPQPLMSRFNYSYYLFACKVPNDLVISADEREILEVQFVSKDRLRTTVLSEEASAGLGLLGWL